MLPRRFRLRQKDDLVRLREQGRRFRHPLAILLVQANDAETSRFAFMASRRVGNAVARNRAKRLLREAVRAHLEDAKSGWDCFLIARSSTPEAPFPEVKAAVGELLTRARLLGGERDEP